MSLFSCMACGHEWIKRKADVDRCPACRMVTMATERARPGRPSTAPEWVCGECGEGYQAPARRLRCRRCDADPLARDLRRLKREMLREERRAAAAARKAGR